MQMLVLTAPEMALTRSFVGLDGIEPSASALSVLAKGLVRRLVYTVTCLSCHGEPPTDGSCHFVWARYGHGPKLTDWSNGDLGGLKLETRPPKGCERMIGGAASLRSAALRSRHEGKVGVAKVCLGTVPVNVGQQCLTHVPASILRRKTSDPLGHERG